MSTHWDCEAPFIIDVEVTADDIDGLNHTNNGVYVQWCERAAWAHSNSLGLTLEHYQSLDRAMAVRSSEYDYLAASYSGQQLQVATWISEWDQRLTMRRCFQIKRPHDDVTVLRGSMYFACIELSSGKPRRMPKAFIDGYGPAVMPAPSQS